MIEIKGVTKTFGNVTALNDTTLTIGSGSVFGLVGSNGAGKSTLLRIIAGVYKADRGSVKINSRESYENNKVKQNLIFISDYPYFSSFDTVEKLAKIYKTIYENWSDEKFEYLKSIFPIDTKAKISQMSKGMQRQAAIMLGISTMPECILFDEIFDGLDPVIRELVKRILIDFVEESNATVVIASHNLRELEDVCDHVALLHLGGVLLENDIDALKLGIFRVQLALNNPQDFEKIEKELNIVKISKLGKMIEFTARGSIDTARVLLESINPLFIETLPLTLEELFISEMEAAGYDINNLVK